MRKGVKKEIYILNRKMIEEDSHSDYVLTPCRLPESIDVNFITFSLNKKLILNMSLIDDHSPLTFHWKELEDIVANASNGIRIGSGNKAVDVLTKYNEKSCCSEGIDVTNLSCDYKSRYTNEKSVVQNFRRSESLSELFQNDQDDTAYEIFKDQLITKLSEVVEKEKITNGLYIVAFISTPLSVYLACFRYSIENIRKTKSNGFTSCKKSIEVCGFVDSHIGHMKLYKSKTRLELRLESSYFVEENPFVTKLIDFNKLLESKMKYMRNGVKDHYTVISYMMQEFGSSKFETVEDIEHQIFQKQKKRFFLENQRDKWTIYSNERLFSEKKLSLLNFTESLSFEKDNDMKLFSKIMLFVERLKK